MAKYFNTLNSPVLYNNNGQTIDGFSWLETSPETAQIVAALKRGELLKVDSDGKLIYDIIEPPLSNENNASDEQSEPEAKKTSSKKSEG